MRIYLPMDSAAQALGADELAVLSMAEAAKHGADINLIRNGSRGMIWLEPLVEVVVNGVHVGFGPMQSADVAGLFGDLSVHPKVLGPVDALPWMQRQTRLIPTCADQHS